MSKAHLGTLLERIRKAVENCDNTEGFVVTHSLGGGTGSGFTSVLMHTLQAEYAKFCRVQVPVFPGQTMSTAVVEPYNSLLHIHATIECVDLSLLFGNEALYELCSNLLFIDSSNFTNINRVVALILSSATAGIRFKGTLNNDLGELQTNLVPYPRIHFPILRYSPILHFEKTKHIKPSVAIITRDVFTKRYQTLKTDITNGRYIAVVLNYRGAVSQRDINNTIQTMKLKRELDFVDWCPTGFKISLNSSMQTIVPESEIAPFDFSVSMIANNTAIKDAWLRLSRKYISLYQRKAFVHWYMDEGMEEFEFDDAYENVLMLIEDYNECCLTSAEIEDLLVSPKPETKKKDVTPVKSPKAPKSDASSRLLVRRHSNRMPVEPPIKKAAHRRVKNKSSKVSQGKGFTRIEKKLMSHMSASQLANTALLRASSSVAK